MTIRTDLLPFDPWPTVLTFYFSFLSFTLKITYEFLGISIEFTIYLCPIRSKPNYLIPVLFTT